MTNPIKLTDEVLDNLFRAICGDVAASATEAEEALAAIRALRDAARAVCDAAKLADSRLSINGWDAIRDLRDLLPDEPKGGGL